MKNFFFPLQKIENQWITVALLLFLLPLQRLAAQGCSPDVVPPVIACPSNVTVNVAPGICSTQVNLNAPTTSDNCPGAVTVSSNAPANDTYPNGQTTVVFTAADAAGNTASCQTAVTVQGGAVYTITCNDHVTLPADPSGFTTVHPEDMLEGGPYNCVQTFCSIGTAGPTPSATVAGTGDFLMVCWVAIPGGGFNQCWGTLTIGAGPCAPDVIPPIGVCNSDIVVQTNMHGPNLTRVTAEEIDAGSNDDCSPTVKLRASLDITGTVPPTTTSVDLVGIGETYAALWVGDDAGNWNKCWTTIFTTAPVCNPDVTPPTLAAPPDMTLTQEYFQSLNLDLNDSLGMVAAFGAAQHWDNCSNGNSLVIATYSVVIFPGGGPKEITRTFWAFDSEFNASTIETQVVTILPEASTIHFPAWFFPDDTTEDDLSFVSGGADLLARSYEDLIYVAPCNGEKIKVERVHTIIDWLTYAPTEEPINMPELDLDNDGQIGDPYDVVLVGDSLYRVQDGLVLEAIAPRTGAWRYHQILRYNYLDTFDLRVSGTVFLDTSSDCSFDFGEKKLVGWKVKGIGQTTGNVYTATTNFAGEYNLFVCPDDAAVEVSLDESFNYGQGCPTAWLVNVVNGSPSDQDIAVKLDDDCERLSTDLSVWRLRPCFPGTYKVSYCNLSDQHASGVHVEVALDTFIHNIGSSIPGTPLGGNVFDFPIGNLPSGHCGFFEINFTLDCDAPLGMTHCSEAHIFPDVPCGNIANYQGPWLTADAICADDSVRLILKNIGNAPTEPSQEFVVVEDLIMYMSGGLQLAPGDTREIVVPAGGETWHIQARQADGHPWGGFATAFSEGCGGLNQPGAPLAFPNGSNNPFQSTDCQQNVSSFDPNDKQAMPQGYDNQHFIEVNTDLDYTIRFQNTGTDTAYHVVIFDTLSTFLDIRTVKPGASSHRYDFDVLPGNVLRFDFENILLPDSSDNLDASQGFVKFRVEQRPDLPLGTQIRNRAAIVFDQNDPVLTNQTWHTVGEDFIEVSSDDNPTGGFEKLKTYPNPAFGTVFFELPEAAVSARFSLTDITGRLVFEKEFSEKTFRFDRAGLPEGAYFFKILTDGGRAFSGKVVLK